MEINAVDHQSTHAGQLASLHGTDPEVEEVPDQTPEAGEASEPTPPADESSVEQTSEDTETKGVLQNLLEGHFKGVSDVRLRINFFDELAAIEAGQLQAVAEENIDGVLQAVGAIVGTLAAEGEPTEEPPVELPLEPPVELPIEPPGEPPVEPTVEPTGELTPELLSDVLGLQETFAQTVNQLKDDFLAAETPSIAALDEGIQSAFDAFVAALESALALAPDTGDVTAEEATPATLESEPGLEGFIVELRAAFDAAMDELIDAFGEVVVLPELSEPSGNGVAYEKFLAIYNGMRGVAPADEASQPVEPLEAEG